MVGPQTTRNGDVTALLADQGARDEAARRELAALEESLNLDGS